MRVGWRSLATGMAVVLAASVGWTWSASAAEEPNPPATRFTYAHFTIVNSGEPGRSYWNGPGPARVGRDRGAFRAYWAIDISRLQGHEIRRAKFVFTGTYSRSCTPHLVRLRETGPFDKTTTWNTRPAPGAVIGAAQVAAGGGADCPPTAVALDSTAALQSAVDRGVTTWYVGLQNADEASAERYKEFATDFAFEVSHRPRS